MLWSMSCVPAEAGGENGGRLCGGEVTEHVDNRGLGGERTTEGSRRSAHHQLFSISFHFYFKSNTALTLHVCLLSVKFNQEVEMKFNLWLHYERQN